MLVLFALSIAISVRMVPKNLSGINDQIARSEYSYVKQQITSTIQQQNPGLPAAYLQSQIDSAYQATINNATYQNQIDSAIAQGIKQQKSLFVNPSTGRPFMPDIDPYFWLYYADNLVSKGHIGDSVRNGVQWDNRELAPNGRPVTGADFHPYLIAGLYKVMHAFNHGITVMLAQEWYPVIFFALIVILTFLIGASITNAWGGFFAATVLALIPGALNRTVWGRGDTDALVIFFPLLTLYLFMEAFTVKDLWAKLTFASLAGLVAGFFAWAWSGWWYVPMFAFATIGLYLAYRMVRYAIERSLWKKWPWVVPLIFIAALAALIGFVWIGSVRDFNVATQIIGFPVAGLAGLVVLAGIGLYLLGRVSKNEALRKGGLKENYEFWNQAGVWQPVSFTAAFGVITVLSLLVFRHTLSLLTSFLGVFSFGQIKAPTNGATFFPNVYTTVAELNPAKNLQQVFSNLVGNVTYHVGSVQGVLSILVLAGAATLLFFMASRMFDSKPIRAWLSVLGGGLLGVVAIVGLFKGTIGVGTILLALAIVGVIAAIVGKQDEDGFDVRYGILLLVWVAATTYATLLGVRFVLLLAPAFAIAVGAGAGYLAGLASDAFPNEARWRWGATIGMIALLSVLVFAMPGTVAKPNGNPTLGTVGLYSQAHTLAGQDLPLMDTTWYALLHHINQTTPNDTIITSWWDFGHIFKYYAHRPVTFDGATQNTQVAHWVGKLLLTRSEKQSIGILRMLDCSDDSGFNRINSNITHDQFETLHIIDNITTMNKSQATTYLQGRGYSASDIDYILQQTHCTPPQGLLIASGDMVGKAGVWGHFGAWDFRRADVYDKISNEGLERTAAIKLIEQQLNQTYTQAFDTYDTIHSSSYQSADQWIAPYPSILGTAPCTGSADNLTCTVNLQSGTVPVHVNATAQQATIATQNGTIPAPFGMMVNGTFVTHDLNSPITLGFALLTGNNQIVVSSPQDVGSIFERLYYYGGQGLPCYTTFMKQNWPRGGMINTYSANWTCADQLS